MAITICNAARLLEPILWVIVVRFAHYFVGQYLMHTANFLRRLKRAGLEQALLFGVRPDSNRESNHYLGKKWGERFIVATLADRAFDKLSVKRGHPGGLDLELRYLARDRTRTLLFQTRHLYSYKTFPHAVSLDFLDSSYKWWTDPEQTPADVVAPFSFGEAERAEAKERLAGMGINRDDSYILFLGRDGNYLKTHIPETDFSDFDYRNVDIAKYLPAMNWVVDNHMKAVRIGRHVAEPLGVSREGIIDYSSMPPDDFLDVHLMANCLFLVSANTGMYYLALLLGKWLLACNMPHIYAPGNEFRFYRRCYTFKKYWCHKKRRFLSFREIFQRRIEYLSRTRTYFINGITLVENTGEELLAAVRETCARASGQWVATAGETEIQNKYKSLLDEFFPNLGAGIGGVLSYNFMRANPWLLADA
ncbi:MAG: TIGR04372 family glycosyltransferase [Planctomycetota bacterium]|nr:TIGR04372 family glycosyltransferase [Planctomycetota bacterium]